MSPEDYRASVKVSVKPSKAAIVAKKVYEQKIKEADDIMKKTTKKTVDKVEVKAATVAKGVERICTNCKKLKAQDEKCLDCMSSDMKYFESAV
jgi:hypothetical protein